MSDRPGSAFFLASFLVVASTACGGDPASTPVDAGSDEPSVDARAADASTTQPDAADDAPAPTVSCSAYCALVATNCSGPRAQFDSSEQCLRLCRDLPAGAFGDVDDSIGCRQAHAIAAATDPAKHCAAAGSFGGGLCGDRCDDYCSVMLQFCNGPDAPYTSKSLCWNDCLNHFKFDTNAGEYADAGNTLNCREGYLVHIGALDAGDHAATCAAAGPQSDPCR